MKTLTQTQRIGSVKWLEHITGDHRRGRVSITSNTKSGDVTKEYTVHLSRAVNGRGCVTLSNVDSREFYSVNLNAHTCTCADHAYRHTICKHQKAMAAALRAVNLY
jgi:hypothetical protein